MDVKSEIQKKVDFFRFLLSLLFFDPTAVIKIIRKKHVKSIKVNSRTTILGGDASLLPEIVEEIFFKKVYTPDFMQIHPGDIIVDIGANIGTFGIFANNRRAGMIYSVEPSNHNVKLLRKNFELNEVSNYTIVEAAVVDKKGWAEYYSKKFDPHGSLKLKKLETKALKVIRVKTTTLGGLLSQQGIERVDFLKMDCEGSEGEIVLSTTPTTWKKVKKLAMEYHNDLSIISNNQILKELKKNGFNTQEEKIDSKLGYIYAWKK